MNPPEGAREAWHRGLKGLSFWEDLPSILDFPGMTPTESAQIMPGVKHIGTPRRPIYIYIYTLYVYMDTLGLYPDVEGRETSQCQGFNHGSGTGRDGPGPTTP